MPMSSAASAFAPSFEGPKPEVHPLAVKATMPNDEFPLKTPRDLGIDCPRELRHAESALAFYYREQAGEIMLCPPRSGIEIRRDIRRARIDVRRQRRLARAA